MKAIAASVLALALAAPAAASEVKSGELTLSALQVRATPPGVANTAAYLVIVNSGDKPDKLLSASCACAGRVDVHVSHVMNGTAMMMPTGSVAIPAHGQVALRPGGQHLMVVGLKAPLQDGAVQELVLKFQRAGAVSARFDVKARLDLAPGG